MMKNLGTKELETKRLILRKFKKDDVEYMFKNWANNSQVTKYLTWPPHKDINDTKTYIEKVITEYGNPDNYNWAIELKEINQVIGSISVVSKNKNLKIVHIGYCIGEKWWNRGITTEAFRKLIRFFFEDVKINRIESRHDPKNISSGKVMLKCGLKYEGTLRQSDINNQGICDCAWYSILKSEYEVQY